MKDSASASLGGAIAFNLLVEVVLRLPARTGSTARLGVETKDMRPSGWRVPSLGVRTRCGMCHMVAVSDQSRERGFTLLELLAVLAIIAVLSGLVIPRVVHRSEQARVMAARVDVAANIPSALDMFELDNGFRYRPKHRGVRQRQGAGRTVGGIGQSIAGCGRGNAPDGRLVQTVGRSESISAL